MSAGRLYPPGSRTRSDRKTNRWYIWKGRLLGRQREIVCRDESGRPTADARAAKRFLRRLFATSEKLDRGAHAQARGLTFATAAQAYANARNLPKAQRKFVDKLARELGHLPIAAIRQADLDRAAGALYPHAVAATKNRQVYATGAAILHYGAENDWCEYRRIKKLREPKPETRRPRADTFRLLFANTRGLRRLLIMVLFRQGWRISEALAWRADKIDMAQSVTEIWVPKSRLWKTVPLHYEVVAAVAARTDAERWHAEKWMRVQRPGHVFPWRVPSQVYWWLRPLCRKLGLEFTPHMARHEFASALREQGATPRDLVDAGSWTSERSTARYDRAAAERARALVNKLG